MMYDNNMIVDAPFGLFEPISISNRLREMQPEKVELVNYFITEYLRYENLPGSISFVCGIIDQQKVAFTYNQLAVTNLAGEIFEGSEALTPFEDEILDQTFLRLAKKTPTRPNRM